MALHIPLSLPLSLNTFKTSSIHRLISWNNYLRSSTLIRFLSPSAFKKFAINKYKRPPCLTSILPLWENLLLYSFIIFFPSQKITTHRLKLRTIKWTNLPTTRLISACNYLRMEYLLPANIICLRTQFVNVPRWRVCINLIKLSLSTCALFSVPTNVCLNYSTNKYWKEH